MRRLGDLIDQIDLHGQNKELVDELVALSTKYGILTPYTSFLADERVQLHARVDNADRARLRLNALNSVDGQAGVSQRSFKQDLMAADRASSAIALAPMLARNESIGRATTRGAGGGQMAGKGMGGMMGGGLPRQRAMAKSTLVVRVQGPGEAGQSPEGKVRQIGAKTFYWKNGRWVDSTIQPDEDAKAKSVTQLTEEYFELARTQKAEYNQYLSQSEPVSVKLDGKVYHVEPATQTPAP